MKSGVCGCVCRRFRCAATNAAMIGAQAYYEYLAGNTADSSLNAMATMSIDKNFADYAGQ